jgi:cytoskeletal protein CcmA (bactofilin family)
LGNDDVQVVLDRRQGDRRQRTEAAVGERRREDRRHLPPNSFGEITCFLGEGTRFKGDLAFGGAVRVDGDLEGRIVRGEALIIGERGRVNADIEVQILQVSGQVQGNITARQRAELLSPSLFIGTLRTPCLVISRGAVIRGNIEMAGL